MKYIFTAGPIVSMSSSTLGIGCASNLATWFSLKEAMPIFLIDQGLVEGLITPFDQTLRKKLSVWLLLYFPHR